MKSKIAVLWIVLAAVLILLYQQTQQVKEQHKYILSLESELQRGIEINETQQEMIKANYQHMENLETTMQDIQRTLNSIELFINNYFDIEVFELSAYAPLDPNAVEGMCYSGDPSVTRTGAKVEVGTTIAVDPTVIPLGSKVWIEGYGWRIAQDTGGLIKGNRIDIAVATRGEAFRIGRKDVNVLYVPEQ